MPSATKYNKLAGKRVLVVGGTTGIGYCVAEGCLEHGATVILTGSSDESAQRAVTRLRASYPSAGADQIVGYGCNLAVGVKDIEANVTALLERATQGGKLLDHIAFLAGDDFSRSPITEVQLDDIAPLLAVRLYGGVAVAKLAPRYMEVSPGSSLTLTSGLLSQRPMEGTALVAAISGAVSSFGLALALELRPIRVNVISPGHVYTERMDRLIPEEGRAAYVEMAKKISTTGEVGAPVDVAEAYLYVMRDRFVSGENIGSNGGRLLL